MKLFLLTLFASFGFSLSNVLFTHFARKISSVLLVIIRGFWMCIFIFPFLFLIDLPLLDTTLSVLPKMLLGSAFTTVSIILIMQSVKYLPVGAQHSIRSGLNLFWSVLLATILLKEYISLYQFIVLFIIIVLIFLLSYKKQFFVHLSPKWHTGILLITISTLFLALGLYLISQATKVIHPFLVGFAWEFSSTLFAALFYVSRHFIFPKHKIKKEINLKECGLLGLYALPASLGSIAYVSAFALGKYSTVRVISTIGIGFTILLGHLIFREKLSRSKLFLILAIGLSISIFYLLK